MKLEEYNAVVKTIQNYRGLSIDCAKMLTSKYPSIGVDTINSILQQEIQQKMKVTHRRTFGNDYNYYETYLEAVRRKEPAGILLKLATQLKTCPALLARKVLEQSINIHEGDNAKRHLNRLLKDTTLIEDQNLAYEVYLCVLYDDQYGPIANAVNESVGEFYEKKLEDILTGKGISYHNENHLRTKGYDKTPDCKLEVPIAVNGFVINWIESKAQFGNRDVHKKYIKEQFLSYWNRFGPGLVIYWFGFLDDITQSDESRFIIMDHFPENIIFMDPSSIRQSLEK